MVTKPKSYVIMMDADVVKELTKQSALEVNYLDKQFLSLGLGIKELSVGLKQWSSANFPNLPPLVTYSPAGNSTISYEDYLGGKGPVAVLTRGKMLNWLFSYKHSDIDIGESIDRNFNYFFNYLSEQEVVKKNLVDVLLLDDDVELTNNIKDHTWRNHAPVSISYNLKHRKIQLSFLNGESLTTTGHQDIPKNATEIHEQLNRMLAVYLEENYGYRDLVCQETYKKESYLELCKRMTTEAVESWLTLVRPLTVKFRFNILSYNPDSGKWAIDSFVPINHNGPYDSSTFSDIILDIPNKPKIATRFSDTGEGLVFCNDNRIGTDSFTKDSVITNKVIIDIITNENDTLRQAIEDVINQA